MSTTTPVQVEQLTPFIGSVMLGVTYDDLKRDEVWQTLVDIVHQRELVVVRGLRITPEQQVELAGRLGTPKPFLMAKYRHPEFPEIMISSNATRAKKPIGVARVGNFWHQDSTYQQNPAPYTMLHGVQVPSTSGHTLYASACDVYDRLPEEWKQRIADRTALHTVNKRQRISSEHVGLSIAEFRALVDQEYPKVEHPLVKRDPASGRQYLYGAPEYMDSVVGFDANENAEFFALLDSLIQDPERVYTHRWTTDDLVVWKTETTYHAATAVAPDAVRTVHRVSIDAAEPWEA
ncbi:TauD/TfdA dioxygenase family protein [Streptomyces fimicarius]|uniref:TauD/TfdA dioxygenase family protein n=1 Tax=Streptomyces caviscabies TaxID=90079 RepID=A0ABW2MHM2_9ACTN|nr:MULTISPECIES: TauD/TfdA family dioxygenase [Streptomyces]MCL6291196.1 TauD/TfdA family dioxygenase [Streptomyces sp. 43Y-GA-1]MCX4710137.1 TauD/TfdA family dioxygenase [Streptomyces griseus]MDX2669472.1 TauD/TfdA family dioxygenase [Streptomyces sp. NRRL_ISP-5395]MDX3500429.1 TauD/TfdA family dioxygenase [Streptomyces sp. ATCC51928]MDX3591886.1 TauD/TfdA family dioxygenase [Streptomyces sp. ID03-2B]